VFDVLKTNPIVAVLRGIQPKEAQAVGEALLHAGIRIMEVTLNSPNPLQSIEILAKEFGHTAVIGAGTVVDPSDCQRVADHGGTICVSPNTNISVIKAAIAAHLTPFPGFMTPSEAFIAIDAGARFLKLFPGSSVPMSHIKALKPTLPEGIGFIVNGGVSADNAADWLAAGADGIGMGSELFRPGDQATDVRRKANAVVARLPQQSS